MTLHCTAGARHWFSRGVGDYQPFCTRCGETRVRCPECGALTALEGEELACRRGHRFAITDRIRARRERAAAIRAARR